MTTVAEADSLRTIERRIEQVYQLPPMPELGRRILALQSNPNASARELAAIVELDPSLAAQVIRYANSSYYGYGGRISKILHAISSVLGYDAVLNMALGLAAGRSFKIPDSGPLGLTSFWENAVCSAVLVQRLQSLVPAPLRPSAGESYLSGLLHDFGLLLLGHLFPPEFRLLNRMAAAHPEQTLVELECRLLGMGGAQEMLAMGHARIGAWLMQTWKMPEAIRVTLLEHHNSEYQGEHEVLVHLVQIADALLIPSTHRSREFKLPAKSLDRCRIHPEAAVDAGAHVLGSRAELLKLSSFLTAAS